MPSSFTWTSPRIILMRKKKAQLQNMCKYEGIEFDPKETKQDLVDKLYPKSKALEDTGAIVTLFKMS